MTNEPDDIPFEAQGVPPLAEINLFFEGGHIKFYNIDADVAVNYAGLFRDQLIEAGFELTSPGNRGGSGPRPAPAPVVPQANAPKTPPCEACGGATDYRTGVNKNGKPYTGFFCQGNRDHVKWV